MLTHPEQVVVTAVGDPTLAFYVSAVHHREFPEVQGEGHSPEDAAGRLAERLARSLDGAPSDWHREDLRKAIEDVRAFAARGGA